MKILLLNGPPGSGKDHAARVIRDRYFGRVAITKFAKVLKERTHALYGLGTRDDFGNLIGYPHDEYEHVKDEPSADFLGLTPRQAYIAVSETYFKRHHGEPVFGKLLEPELRALDTFNDLIVISDSGFLPEALYLRETFGPHALDLVALERRGSSFERDSRDYWTWPGQSRPYLVSNNSTDDALWKELQIGCEWLR